jgi:protein-disulfide isomerase
MPQERKYMLFALRNLCLLSLLGLLAQAQQSPVGAAPKARAPLAAANKSADPSLPSEETVNAFLQQMLGMDPGNSWKVVDIKPSPAAGLAEVDIVLSGPRGSQPSTLYVTSDLKHVLIGQILPFGDHPFEAARRTLEKGVTGPARGPADAAVTIVEFSDLQCPHCKEEQPNIDKLLTEEKNVRVVYQNFPLPLHDWAAKAAAYAECIGRSSNDVFWKFIESVYAAQSDITAANATEKLNALAEQAGAKSAEVAVCADKPETVGRVERSVELGKALGINSTPTLFINGREVGGIPYEALKSLAEFAAKPVRGASSGGEHQ